MTQEFMVVKNEAGQLMFQDDDGMQIDRIEAMWFRPKAVVTLFALGEAFELMVVRGRNLKQEEYGVFNGAFFARKFKHQTGARAIFANWLEIGEQLVFEDEMLVFENVV